VRLIVPDPVAAREILHDAGFTTHLSQVICVAVSDEPAVSRACSTRSPNRRSRSTISTASRSTICFAVHDIEHAVELLAGKVTLLSTSR